jgi:hypothetical protein
MIVFRGWATLALMHRAKIFTNTPDYSGTIKNTSPLLRINERNNNSEEWISEQV